MVKIKEIVDYLGGNNFVKFNNVDDFSNISNSTKNILSNFGIYSNKKSFPFLTSNGVLKETSSTLIKVGEDIIGNYFCIDTATDYFILYDVESNSISNVNSSLEKYLLLLYTYRLYNHQIELKGVFGNYWENHKKYAFKLSEMFKEIEPNISEFELWAALVHEKELGVI